VGCRRRVQEWGGAVLEPLPWIQVQKRCETKKNGLFKYKTKTDGFLLQKKKTDGFHSCPVWLLRKRVENQLTHIGPHNSQNNPQPIIEVSKFQIIPSVPQKPNGQTTPKKKKVKNF
jgi:hypothetical protein